MSGTQGEDRTGAQAAPIRLSPKKKGNTAAIKRVFITAGVVGYITAAALGTVYGSAALYQVMHKEAPHDLTIRSSYDYWQATESNPADRKKFKLALGVPAAVLFLVIPLLLASIQPAGRELYGNARFANVREVEQAGLFGSKGIILGRLNGRFLILDGPRSVSLSAPTRSGKGAGVVVPNCLAWHGSLVALDVKPELYRITAGYRAMHGQKVYAWAPFSDDARSHGYNPLFYVRSEYRYVVGDILDIAAIVFNTRADDSATSNFFKGQARNLFLGLALYLVETPELPRTIGEILRQASGKGKPLRDHLSHLVTSRQKAGRPLSDTCVDALSRFLQSADDTLSGIVNTMNEPLLVFSDPFVDAATSRNDFDLRDLRRQLMSVYVCIPVAKLGPESRVLLNLFYAQLLKLNTQHLPEFFPEFKHQVLLVNDEFTTMGRVEAFTQGIGYLAGFGLRCLTVFQSRSQLQDCLGEKAAENYLTNHGAEILFAPAPQSQKDAEEYSRVLGTFTEKSKSTGRSSNFGKGGGGSNSTNTSPQKRPLLWPQEFKDLGEDKEVVLIENVRPILAEKVRYFEDEVFTARVVAPPLLPVIDLNLYRARVEGRIRPAQPGETFTLERLVADLNALPKVDEHSSEAEQVAFVNEFLNAMLEQPPEAANDEQAGDSDEATESTDPEGGERTRRRRKPRMSRASR